MNEQQKKYIRNQIFSMPIRITQDISNHEKKFNKRSDFKKITKYIFKKDYRVNCY